MTRCAETNRNSPGMECTLEAGHRSIKHADAAGNAWDDGGAPVDAKEKERLRTKRLSTAITNAHTDAGEYYSFLAVLDDRMGYKKGGITELDMEAYAGKREWLMRSMRRLERLLNFTPDGEGE